MLSTDNCIMSLQMCCHSNYSDVITCTLDDGTCIV